MTTTYVAFGKGREGLIEVESTWYGGREVWKSGKMRRISLKVK